MKRILLFGATNLAVMLTVSIVLSLLGSAAIHRRRPGLRRAGWCSASSGAWPAPSSRCSCRAGWPSGPWACSSWTAAAATKRPTGSTGPSSGWPARRSCRCPKWHLRLAGGQRVRHRPEQESQPGRGLERAAARHAARRSRRRARPRGGAHRQRRHGHDDAHPGRGERVRDVRLARSSPTSPAAPVDERNAYTGQFIVTIVLRHRPRHPRRDGGRRGSRARASSAPTPAPRRWPAAAT